MKALFINEAFRQVPLLVRRFLLKAILLFAVWKLAYHLVLVPLRWPDRPLTEMTAQSSAFVYTFVSGAKAEVKEGPVSEGIYSSSLLFIDGKRAVGIVDPCNGLELYVLYLGFLFCIPQPFTKKLLYIVLGIAGIYVLNTLRCVGIAWLNLHYISLADFAHHYFFKLIIYAAVFFAWVKYSKSYFGNG